MGGHNIPTLGSYKPGMHATYIEDRRPLFTYPAPKKMGAMPGVDDAYSVVKKQQLAVFDNVLPTDERRITRQFRSGLSQGSGDYVQKRNMTLRSALQERRKRVTYHIKFRQCLINEYALLRAQFCLNCLIFEADRYRDIRRRRICYYNEVLKPTADGLMNSFIHGIYSWVEKGTERFRQAILNSVFRDSYLEIPQERRQLFVEGKLKPCFRYDFVGEGWLVALIDSLLNEYIRKDQRTGINNDCYVFHLDKVVAILISYIPEKWRLM
jgi:hypothetical protein